jgi:transcriptional regulator GlxA family with amidase domain
MLEWVRRIDATTQWTTSVCTGSLILGAAGLLKGQPATTHWARLEKLREFGAEPRSERVVEDGKIVTAAGVSAGIDMALHLVRRVAGDTVAQAIQVGIEYDPQPPFDGNAKRAPAPVMEVLRPRYQRN